MTRIDEPEKITTTEARQGNGRRMNLRVLVISLIGVVVLLAVIYMVYAMQQPVPTA